MGDIRLGQITEIETDTNELQTDWVNGGRLDLIIDATKATTDKQAGSTVNNITAAIDWNAAESVVVAIGTAATRNKPHSLLLDVSALSDGAAINVRMYQKINDNADVKIYDETFTINNDPDGLWIVNGSVATHDVLTVKVESDTAESVAIEYTYVLEAM